MLSIAQLMEQTGVGFGTSGARGLADAMNDRVCYAYTQGFLQYLEKAGDIRPGDSVAVAGDFRPSTPRIMRACLSAAADMGYQAINAGYVPSPAVANLGLREGIASMMVTGSHIPDDRNGIKFNKPDGEVLKADEAGIRAQEIDVPEGRFTDEGFFAEPPPVPEEDPDAGQRYIQRYLDFFGASALDGSRVLLYEHSTVAASSLKAILGGLGAQVQSIAHSDVFVPVDTEAVRPEDVALARDWAAQHSFDLIVSADGDGDRPLIGDEQGEWLRGDVLGVLTGHYLGADAAATPVSSNSVLERSGWFSQCVRTRIGSPFVIEGMQQAAESGARQVVGYEANGGFLTFTDFQIEGRTLPALPTRDAALVAIAVLMLARREGKAVSQLAQLLPARFTASDRLKAFPTELSRSRIAAMSEGGETAIREAFPALGRVAHIDQTDGLRMTFENDEVVHLRPSGNAPELRCYNEADSAERAAQLNRECLAQMTLWRE